MSIFNKIIPIIGVTTAGIEQTFFLSHNHLIFVLKTIFIKLIYTLEVQIPFLIKY